METVADFVRRTEGPAVPFVPDWYPWVYAHHYLRLEEAGLPPEFHRGTGPFSLAEAQDLVYLWCGLSGESVQPAARMLADAYLRRWGILRGTQADPAATPATSPGRRSRRQPQAARPSGAGRSRRLTVAPSTRSA
ncbi:hypothetical protein [Rugosimonospora africana]|uniref:Uncharacterized protein n=1 Tax=Rugosimonospora africana TaxID=556532 RepID=A0A8J3QW82_9ACTN|nr:hypothetical protein [Rugosimonospora africana]GIH18003.1 hypothetical protein Raf01_61750 [Rugosimonospora africana]